MAQLGDSVALIALGFQLFAFGKALATAYIQFVEWMRIQNKTACGQAIAASSRLAAEEVKIVHGALGASLPSGSMAAHGLSDIVGARPDQPVIPILLEDMRGPARHAADGEDGREQIDGDAQRIVPRSRIEIDVGVQALQFVDGLFYIAASFRTVGVGRSVLPIVRESFEVDGPRIERVIDAMAEAGDFHFVA